MNKILAVATLMAMPTCLSGCDKKTDSPQAAELLTVRALC